ncbi:hypothetical protein CRG98_009372 [Punica granatum]|uniref:C2H2-type domain-containing protein n=2 Tax=Punica granatum TaxID=22663 RepID=A0A2I0KPH9_PUNGR|nr:hypothetical protein CRG98_009372 [Punica granatum]
MADHDQRKNHPSSGTEGHQQMHHCHKCGWPFPNPHPSAKHRRAHRRICGTIEGYKLEDSQHSNVSDDEHSDDDYKTPSAKALERSESEKDEVFSDAASNFADVTSCTVTEAAKGTVLESESISEKVKEDIPAQKTAEVMKADDSTDSAEKQELVIPESTADVFASKSDAPDHSSSSPVGTYVDSAEESTAATIRHENVLIDGSVLIVPKPSIGLITEAKKHDEDKGVSECLLESVSRDTEVKALEETDSLSHDNNHARDTPEAIPKLETGETTVIPMPPGDVKIIEETNPLSLDGNSVSNAPEPIPKLEETCRTVATGLSPEDKAPNQVGLSGDAPQAEFHVDRELEFSTSCNDVHENDKREVDEHFHEFFVPHGLPEVENPERVIEGFKDPKIMGLFHTNDGSSEVILNKDDVIIASPPESGLEAVNEGSGVSSGLQDSEVPSELAEKSKPVEEAAFIEGKIIPHHGNIGLTDLEICKGAVTADSEEVSGAVNASSEMEFSESAHELLGSVDGNSKVDIAHTAEVDQVEKHTERLEEVLAGGVPESASKLEKSYIAEEENKSKRVAEESLVENLIVPETAENFHEVPVNSVANPIGEERTFSHEKQVEEKSTAAKEDAIVSADHVQESCKVEDKHDDCSETVMTAYQDTISHENLTEGDLNEKDKRAQLSSKDRAAEEDVIALAGHVQESCEAEDKQEIVMTAFQDTVSDSHEYVTEGGMNEKDKRTQSSSDDRAAKEDVIVSADHVQESCKAEDKHDGYSETLTAAQDAVSDSHETLKEGDMNEKDKRAQLPSEDHVVEETLVSLDSASSVPASAAIEVGGANDLGGPGSDPSQHEGETNHVKPPLSGYALDASVDSRSTDSLDANWGSVSVLSTQSDTLAAVEDSKATSEAGKSTSNLPKLESEANRSLEKSEVFEPPSFMTLVEPTGKGEKTATSSSHGQPGWFPSLTNVTNDSPGRKKNEEIISKVTNWSSNQQQHSPLKSLLIEANRDAKPKSTNPRESAPVEAQKEEKSVTVGSILGSETQKADEEKQATAQEWNSPARYPAEIKREKRKVKGRPIWAQFVCCSSSVN